MLEDDLEDVVGSEYESTAQFLEAKPIDSLEDEASNDLGGGASEEFSEHWFTQAVNGTCVPSSVAQIVAEYTGITFTDESVFVQYAAEQGFFANGDISAGMTAQAGAAILEAAGIPAEVDYGSIGELSALLDEGYGVMLAVDSGNYWTPDQELFDEMTGRDAGADHCVVVTEIDEHAGVVYLSDTGLEGGNQLQVPIERFEEAWAESNNQMIHCDSPSPNIDQVETEDMVESSDVGLVADETDYSTTLPDGFPTPDDIPAMENPSASETVDSAINWATRNPWVLLPVLLGATSAVASVIHRTR